MVLASTDALATAVLGQAGGTTAGQMAPAEQWAKLDGGSRTSSGRIAYVPVPKASVVCFVAPGVDQQIAKWQQLPFWKDNASHGLLKALKTVAAREDTIADDVLGTRYLRDDSSCSDDAPST